MQPTYFLFSDEPPDNVRQSNLSHQLRQKVGPQQVSKWKFLIHFNSGEIHEGFQTRHALV